MLKVFEFLWTEETLTIFLGCAKNYNSLRYKPRISFVNGMVSLRWACNEALSS